MEHENVGKINLEDLAELLKADAIGVDRVSVTLWEQGKRHPGFLNILNYRQFLGMTVDELMGVKTNRTLQIELTEEERNMLFATVDEC